MFFFVFFHADIDGYSFVNISFSWCQRVNFLKFNFLPYQFQYLFNEKLFSQLILQPEFFQYELIRKFARAACLDLAGHVESEEKGVCKFKQEGKKRWIQRFVDRFEAMIADVFLKNHQHWYYSFYI